MSPRLEREYLDDGSFIEVAVEPILPDRWRAHGYKYRLAWVKTGKCRVLFDNHHGKTDHFHVDSVEHPYVFENIDQLILDFLKEIKKLGGTL